MASSYEDIKKRAKGVTVAKSSYDKIKDSVNSGKYTTTGIDEAFINSYITDAQKYLEDAQKAYEGVGWSNAKDTYNSHTVQGYLLDERRKKINTWLNANKSRFDTSTYDTLNKNLQSIDSMSKEVLGAFEAAKDYYGQWNTEEQYNAYMQEEQARQAILNSPDFKEYSEKGAAIENPSYLEAIGAEDFWSAINPFSSKAEIGNIVTFSRDNESLINAANWAEDMPGSPIRQTVGEYLAKHMKDDEVGIYNYYLGKGDKAAADAYFESLRDTLSAREGGAIAEKFDDNFFLTALFGVKAGLDQFKTGLEGIDNFFTGAEADPTSPVQYASSYLRDDLGWFGRGTYDLITTTTNMLPSVLVGTLTTGVAGAATMGASALGHAYGEMRNLGYSENQSRLYAGLVAASETTLQSLLGGVAGLGGKVTNNALKTFVSGIDNGIAKIAIRYGGSMLAEGIEESLQSVLEPLFKTWITGDQYDVDWGEAAYSGVLGALSAGLLNSPGSVYEVAQSVSAGRQIKNMEGGVDRLKKLGLDMPEGTAANKLANKINADTGAFTIGNMLNEIGATLSKKNIADIQLSLERKGVAPNDAKTIATWMNKAVEGEYFTRRQVAALEENDVLKQTLVDVVINPKSTIAQRKKSYNDIKADAMRANAEGKKATVKATKQVPEAKDTAKAETVTEGEKTALESVEKDTVPYAVMATVTDGVSEIVGKEGGKFKVRLQDGTTVLEDEADMSPNTEVLFAKAKQLGLNAETANLFIKNYDGSMSAAEYSLAFEEAYKYGAYNFAEAEMSRDGFSSLLNESQRKIAYESGKIDAKYKTAEAQERVNKTKGKKSEGKLHNTIAPQNETQAASLKALGTLAKVLGIDIYTFESDVKNGRRIGANGWYDPNDNSIHIDVYAGQNGRGTILFTAAHELTHMVKQWSPEKFKIFSDFLIENYAKKGVSVRDLVAAQQAKARRNGRRLTFDQAMEEVVADSCEAMLADGRAIEKIAQLKAKDASLWQKVKTFLTDLVARIRGEYKTLNPDSQEGKLVAEMLTTSEELLDMWTEAVVDASNALTTGTIDSDSAAVSSERSEGTMLSERDTDYLDAVNRGDMDTAQRMVDEAAKAAGYTVKAYHGTNKFGFTETDVSKSDDGISFFATDSEDTASTYSSKQKVKRVVDAEKSISEDDIESLQNDIKDLASDLAEYCNREIGIRGWVDYAYFKTKLDECFSDLENGAQAQDVIDDFTGFCDELFFSFLDNYYESNYENNPWLEDEEKITFDDFESSQEVDELADNFYNYVNHILGNLKGLAQNSTSGIYDLYANTDGHLVIECNRSRWDKITADKLPDIKSPEYEHYGYRGHRYEWTTRSIAAYANDLGYKGVTFKNLIDSGDGGSVLPATVYIFFNPQEQIKSADPVTYDNDGNVIPLSERFNAENPDIRYSSRDTAIEEFGTTTDVEQAGFVLDDGRMLKLSQYGQKGVQHRLIERVYEDAKGSEAVSRFIQEGNIRVKATSPGIEIGTERAPSVRQLNTISRFISSSLRAKGEFFLDITDAAGNDVASVGYYEWNDASDVIGDIKDYYERGIVPREAMFSERDPDVQSNRELLAGAIESITTKPEERAKIEAYIKEAKNLDAIAARLSDVRKEIKEISFSKGKRDTVRLRELKNESIKLSNQINGYDKKLLQLESTSVLKGVLERAKKDATAKAKQKGKTALDKYKETANAREREIAEKGKTALAEYKEAAKAQEREIVEKYRAAREKSVVGRRKTEVRGKIRKVVSELDNLLKNPSKEKHVPIALQKPVAEALSIINMDTVEAEKRISALREMLEKQEEKIQDREAKLEQAQRSNLGEEVITEAKAKLERAWAQKDNILKRMATVEAQGSNLSDRLTALSGLYETIKASKDPRVREGYDENIAQMISTTVADVGTTPIRAMTLSQLESVYNMFKAIKKKISDVNKLHSEMRTARVSDASLRVISEIQNLSKKSEPGREIKQLKWLKSFAWAILKPKAAMQIIGSNTFEQLFDNVRKGEDSWAVTRNEASKEWERLTKKHKYWEWDFEKPTTFTDAAGDSFDLSLPQILSLYAYSRRGKADKHLAEGGFIFSDAVEIKEKKHGVTITYTVKSQAPHRLGTQELGAILSTLTEEQRAFVEEAQTYLSDTLGAKGNVVSRALYDINLFGEKNYFPIKSARYYLEYNAEKGTLPNLKNMGHTKHLEPNASNPIILSNFDEIWGGHVNDMAMYSSFVLPLDDFMRVFNYSTRDGGYDSVRAQIVSRYGTAAAQYVETLLRDLNGGARVDPYEGLFGKSLAKFKKAAVFASASVVIQQPSALGRVFAYIEPKYFATKPKTFDRSAWEECKKYAPVAIIKEMGSFDVGTGRGNVDWIVGQRYETRKEKLKGALTDSEYRDELLSKAPAMADRITWVYIWEATKKKVAAEKKLEGEALLEEAGRIFTEAIVNTQVYDSVLTRNALMRSKGVFMKMTTSFMAEPFTALNEMVVGVVKGMRGDAKFARASIASALTSFVFNSVLVSLVYAARDDDEDENYGEKYVESLTTELLESVNMLTYLPIVKDIWSIFLGYGVDRADMTLVERFVQAVETLGNENVGGWEKARKLIESVADLRGVPLRNILRDAEALYNVVDGIVNPPLTTKGVGTAITEGVRKASPRFMQEWYQLPERATQTGLVRAIESGDSTVVKLYINTRIEEAEADGKTEKEARSAMRAELTRYYKPLYIEGTASEKAQIRKILAKSGLYGSADEVIKATAKWTAED